MVATYADDLVTGVPYDAGSMTVSADDIVEFATRWDPQPFHVDPAVAEQGYFGELIASGIHSFAIFQRLAVLNVYPGWEIIAGRSVQVDFPKPLRQGATVRASVTIDGVERVSERRSLVHKHGVLLDENDNVVFDLRASAFMRNRPTPLNVRVDRGGASA